MSESYRGGTNELVIMRKAEGARREAVSVGSELYNSRIMFVEGEICAQGVMQIIKGLLALEQQDSQVPITLVVSSPGGEVSAGLALIDTMQALSCPVHTVGMGLVASMGAVILASGDKRSAYANTQVMIHQLIGGTGMLQQSDIEITADHIRDLRSRLDELLAEHGNLSAEEFHELTERDGWCTAQRALDLGIIDEIVPKKGR